MRCIRFQAKIAHRLRGVIAVKVPSAIHLETQFMETRGGLRIFSTGGRTGTRAPVEYLKLGKLGSIYRLRHQSIPYISPKRQAAAP